MYCKKLSAGKHSSFFIDDYGWVWAIGQNQIGELGVGHYVKKVVQIEKIVTVQSSDENERFTSVAARECISLFLNEEGMVRMSGGYIQNKLGRNEAVLLPGLERILEIGAGNGFSLFLDYSGDVWRHGEFCGTSDIPKKIDNISRVRTMATGSCFAIFIDSEGCVWKLESDEELVKIHTTPSIDAISAGISHALLLDSSGQVWGHGSNALHQLAIPNKARVVKTERISELPSEPIKSISCGNYH